MMIIVGDLGIDNEKNKDRKDQNAENNEEILLTYLILLGPGGGHIVPPPPPCHVFAYNSANTRTSVLKKT